MYIGFAKTKEDFDQAINLVANTFSSRENFNTALDNKRFLFFQNPEYQLENLIVISKKETGVIGACFIADRIFYRGNSFLKGTFLSSICIDEKSRGKGFSKLLINFAIAEAEKRLSDFAIVVARKSADYFYKQFNFWGVSQYNEIQYDIPLKNNKFNKILFFNAKNEDLKEINKLYTSTYSKLFGSCKRSDDYWSYILKKSAMLGCNIILKKINEKIKGYIIHSGSEIYEVATDADLLSSVLLNEFAVKFSFSSITIHCSPKHPFVNELKDIDFSMTKRQCNFGGHMIRIIDYKALEKKLINEFNTRFERLGILDYEEEVKGICSLKYHNKQITFRLIESPWTFNSTCLLLGADYLSSDQKTLSIFESHPFNLPLFDQM